MMNSYMVWILYIGTVTPQNEEVGPGINLWIWNGKGSSFKSGSVRVRFAGMEKGEQGRLNKRFIGLEDKRPSEDSLAPCAMLSVDDYIFLCRW